MLILDLLFHRIGFKATLAFPFLAPFPRETAGEATETEFHLKLLKGLPLKKLPFLLQLCQKLCYFIHKYAYMPFWRN